MEIESRSHSPRIDTPDRVVLINVGDASNAEMAELVGYNDSYFGFTVVRYPDYDTAIVSLYKD